MAQTFELSRDPAFGPLERTGPGFYLVAAVLAALIAWGAVGYRQQLIEGLGVTGMQQPVTWALYIVNFVFFIGIAHAGTLISAILRLTGAEWPKPMTRLAEVVTVVILGVGALQIFIDVGRPDRAPFFILEHGRFQSPLLWDMTSITAYFLASVFYLYVPMIPDLAELRDRPGRTSFLYDVLALGWRGTDRQWEVLHRSVAIMSVLVVPIAVSVHSVISFIFSMTMQPMWHSTIFAPYFVIGAIFSGMAAIALVMAALRRGYGLETWLTPEQFRNLGRLLLVVAILWAYFTFAEHLTVFYVRHPAEFHVFEMRVSGAYAPMFWLMVVANFVVPLACLAKLAHHPIKRVIVASVSILVGMWLERYLIVIPTLSSPRVPVPVAPYFPTWIEGAETLASAALFGLAFLLFTKLFPIIPLWEVRERPGVPAASAAPTAPPAPATVRGPHTPSDRTLVVRACQWGLVAAVALVLVAVIGWIFHLVGVATGLDDAPGAAIAIACIAVPVFTFLLGIVVYTFWNLLTDRSAR